ncbi:acyltransferase [Rhodovarius crocodyli]|uniref:Acyltransferase n=1 Tax=Rhodovarius crocodyli TaxID=1979269 RepID=A0A437MCI3_9PROT|nr:acyltransferase [Rhodovarius crocodyli]RVT95273.1 acyltransferase [Rhodovarius crocodyli]
MQIVGKAALNTIKGHAEGLWVEFKQSGCTIIIGEGCDLSQLKIHCHARDCTVKIGRNSIIKGDIFLKSPGRYVVIGDNLRARSATFMNVTGGDITIGDDCLFARVKLRTSDSHHIRDAASGEILNPPGDIKVGNRVWLAEDVLLLRRAEIGDDCAIGTRAVVTGKIPPGCVAAGAPAKVLREGIRWEE